MKTSVKEFFVHKHLPPRVPSHFLQVLDWIDQEDPAITLLKAVEQAGSINQAAKILNMSYKAVWERIETLNNLADEPLIARQVGGSGGGGTQLTQAGQEFLTQAATFRRQLHQLVSYFQSQPAQAFNTLKTLRKMELKISARNVWSGNVAKIEQGAVNSVVTIALKGQDTIVSVITHNSVQRLGLEPGSEVLAIVKATSVMVGLAVDSQRLSARNILRGKVARIVPGKVNDEVIIDLKGGNTVTSILTCTSVRSLCLEEGMEVDAIIKASSVLLAMP
jgi:molybdate transport system regulatory protein